MNNFEKALMTMDSFVAINDVLAGVTLHPKQCIDVVKMLYKKKAIVIYDTGTGKTLLAAAFMKLLLNQDPSRRFIFFCKKDQVVQTPKKLESLTGLPVLCSSSDAKSVREKILSQDMYKYRIILLTKECLFNEKVLNRLYEMRSDITGIIIDEAHELNNTSYASSSEMLQALVSKFEYVIALTATPIRTDIKQLAKLANLVDACSYNNPAKLLRSLQNGKFSLSEEPCFFINRKASELGRVSEPIGHVIWCSPMAQQVQEQRGGVVLMQVCKGAGATSQVNSLIELLRSKKGKRGLVYISQDSIYKWVRSYLDKTEIRYRVIQGETSIAERAEIMDSFNDPDKADIDVVLLSVTTAIDLDCDFVVFYEFTVDVEQMIGRAHRGLENKQLDVYFLITKGTREVNYFVENILMRCEAIAKILGKENTAVKQAGEEIGFNE